MAISSTRPQALPDLRRVLVVGSGGREHALSWALQRDNAIETVGITPGNAGSDQQALAIGETDSTALIAHCQTQSVDLVVVGPEAPLAAGVADDLRQAGIAVFGPGAEGAQLEASKAWAKQLMQEAGVPTAGHWAVTSEADALAVLAEVGRPLVVKADGLARKRSPSPTRSSRRSKRSERPSPAASAAPAPIWCWKSGCRPRGIGVRPLRWGADGAAATGPGPQAIAGG